MAEAEKFYSEVLGLSLRGRPHGAAVYDVGGGELRVSPVPSTKPSKHTVLGFAVADVDAVIDELHRRGIATERFAHLTHDAKGILLTPEGARVAWLRDPDGNLLSVVQYGPAG
jgi:predicted enzyme related to lactoylglutathione lyase